jgi:peroxiredoxin Q/BCP
MAIPQEGLQAPDFKLTAQDGRKVALTDYRGKHVVLFFFVKANTSG